MAGRRGRRGAASCIEYDAVAERLGVRFDTAGGGEKDGTATCALPGRARYPYLTLALTPSAADEVIFMATMQPSGATTVKGLGLIAYRLDVARRRRTRPGPAVEFGWLSAKKRADDPAVRVRAGRAPRPTWTRWSPKLLELAKRTERPAAAS